MQAEVKFMDNPSMASRIIVQEAADQLKEAGYYAFKVTNPDLRVNLIACAHHRVFFIVVKRCRKCTITNHAGTVEELINLVNSGTVPGDVYLWLYRSHSWSRYQILPGGAIQTEGLV
jgi:hypothetical protein